MSILAAAADTRVRAVRITEELLIVDLMDGRTISVPLAWYPRLLEATPAQRLRWEVAGAGYGIHWPEIDEDLSTEGLLLGAPSEPSFAPGSRGNKTAEPPREAVTRLRPTAPTSDSRSSLQTTPS